MSDRYHGIMKKKIEKLRRNKHDNSEKDSNGLEIPNLKNLRSFFQISRLCSNSI